MLDINGHDLSEKMRRLLVYQSQQVYNELDQEILIQVSVLTKMWREDQLWKLRSSLEYLRAWQTSKVWEWILLACYQKSEQWTQPTKNLSLRSGVSEREVDSSFA